ncbi:MAG: SDR family oxidoreductase [Pseudobacteriovorax sp.]|nr:SDR family oxidoreductase [Pseudobacteriovorax sp.]
MDLNLSGKTALVCGASQGIGAGCARELADLGCQIILLARTESKLKDVCSGLKGSGHRYVVADQGDQEALLKALSTALEGHTVDILINNSGGPPGGPITEASDEEFLQAFQRHLIVNANLVKMLLPGMREKRFGRIVNIISTSVKIPLAGLGVSNTIRGAVASWSKTLANEVAQYGITVNSVLPGATKTSRLDQIIDSKASKSGQQREAVAETMAAAIPAGRFGNVEEIASVAAFLSSPAASYVTGTAIPVDGGRTGAI